tara:strand:+ start:119811 stop:120431 length:621 start_codon:yes stop_codon:yes gene_type:complete
MGVSENAFEIERRQIAWSPLTTLNDTVTSLLYDGDPNQVSSSGTDGEQWLYTLPIGQFYKQSDATLWWKSASPNTWVKVIQNTTGSGGAVYHSVTSLTSSNVTTGDTIGSADYTYSVTSSDYYIGVDSGSILSTSQTLAIDLPQPTAQEAGRTIVIKDAIPNVVNGIVNIRAYSGTFVDGVSTYQLNSVPRASVTLYTDGSNYYVV